MHWLLAYTKPRQEALAEEHLRRQGYEVLCPQLRVQKLRRRKWTWVEEPLFPRYLFVGATDDKSWAPVRSTVGVASLVRFGGRGTEIPDNLNEKPDTWSVNRIDEKQEIVFAGKPSLYS